MTSPTRAAEPNAQFNLRQCLAGTTHEHYLDADPTARQLPSIMGVAAGLRPAMDTWIEAPRLPALAKWAERAGVRFTVDGCFEPLPHATAAPAGHHHTTTRARWRRDPGPGSEAHVFLARDEHALEAAVATGWYPLRVGETLVEKHAADHDAFGDALGYPSCCRAFFHARNDWHSDNTPYAAHVATQGAPRAFSNSLLRHTAFGLVPHMACSFACEATTRQASRLHKEISALAPAYAAEMMRRLQSPILSVSELEAFRFEGTLQEPGRLAYTRAETLAAGRPGGVLGEALRMGDEIALEANILHIHRGGRPWSTYFARGDTHGPEAPFLIQCRA